MNDKVRATRSIVPLILVALIFALNGLCAELPIGVLLLTHTVVIKRMLT